MQIVNFEKRKLLKISILFLRRFSQALSATEHVSLINVCFECQHLYTIISVSYLLSKVSVLALFPKPLPQMFYSHHVK